MRLPKRIKGKSSPAHIRSASQERELAKRVGGRTVRGSGCGSEKGDARLEKVCRIEAKTTSAKSFRVTRDMLDKLEEAALPSNELPALVVEFLEEGKPVGEVAVVPTWILDILSQPR
tara:strand:+ start:16085 stop:16435 length:351 start_codon:yes stop_codon:yes gene_type:complete